MVNIDNCKHKWKTPYIQQQHIICAKTLINIKYSNIKNLSSILQNVNSDHSVQFLIQSFCFSIYVSILTSSHIIHKHVHLSNILLLVQLA